MQARLWQVIARLASGLLGSDVHPNDHVNMGQSSNDVIPTAIHVSAALAVERELVPALEHLAETIETKARASLVYDLTTNTVLLQKNADTPLPPAESTTTPLQSARPT
mgnify:CR=1 FL=1